MRDLAQIVVDNGGEVILDLETARNVNEVEGYGRYCTDCGRVNGTCECAWTYAPLGDLDDAISLYGYSDCE